MKIFNNCCFLMAFLFASSCQPPAKEKNDKIKLITLDPGHFHAALVQKSMYDNVDSTVYVYAPKGQDVQEHLKKVESYNSASSNPTHWKEEVYLGDDFLAKMLSGKKGNVVVLAGNNLNKTQYILKSIESGLNVLADKPMVINKSGFDVLKTAFQKAADNKVQLFDIMTERYEITNALQRELSMVPDIFGSFQKGSVQQPAVEMESVHFFYKYVSGSILTRPAWFMDVSQQGEGMVDVATHLVDLVQWECFPNQIIDYKKDIQILGARRWSTDMDLSQFSAITKLNAFPDYLKKDLDADNKLKVFANGEIDYVLKGIHVKVKALWNYKAEEGGDTHYSVLRGTKANMVIEQGSAQKNKPTLYIEPVKNEEGYKKQLSEKFKTIQAKYPGIELKQRGKRWEVLIDEKYKNGHEAHFAQVTGKFLEYLEKGNMPEWEVPNMLAKYYTTTQALALAVQK